MIADLPPQPCVTIAAYRNLPLGKPRRQVEATLGTKGTYAWQRGDVYARHYRLCDGRRFTLLYENGWEYTLFGVRRPQVTQFTCRYQPIKVWIGGRVPRDSAEEALRMVSAASSYRFTVVRQRDNARIVIRMGSKVIREAFDKNAGDYAAAAWNNGNAAGAYFTYGQVVLNRATPQNWDPARLGALLAHELGHVFGLNHMKPRTSLMNEYAPARGVQWWSNADLRQWAKHDAGCR